jgi:adenylate kinase family enzyme
MEFLMSRTLIFGNSGSGKSTLASQIHQQDNVPHFDLDTVAWQSGLPPIRNPLPLSIELINKFISTQDNWVIEGCYSDLLTELLPFATLIIYLDLPNKVCIENAKNRAWEPHKYSSKQQQDANLKMLIAWIKEYDSRNDNFSRQSHLELYNAFNGEKFRLKDNKQYIQRGLK